MPRSNVCTLPTQRNECAQCGRAFQPRTGGKRQRYCSPACRVLYNKERYKRERHKCPLCAKEHQP